MFEKREYFRVPNHGQIQARYDIHYLEVIDVSATGMLIKKSLDLPPSGTLDLSIHYASMEVHFEKLRDEGENTVLVFKIQPEVDELFSVLKQLKDEGAT